MDLKSVKKNSEDVRLNIHTSLFCYQVSYYYINLSNIIWFIFNELKLIPGHRLL